MGRNAKKNILTIRRKLIILVMRRKMESSRYAPAPRPVGGHFWLHRLFEFVSEYDDEITYNDIERWSNSHKWVTTPGEHIPGMENYWNVHMDQLTPFAIQSPKFQDIIPMPSPISGRRCSSSSSDSEISSSNRSTDGTDYSTEPPCDFDLKDVLEVRVPPPLSPTAMYISSDEAQDDDDGQNDNGQDAQDDDDEGNEEQQQMSSPVNNEVNPENNVVNNQPPLLSGPPLFNSLAVHQPPPSPPTAMYISSDEAQDDDDGQNDNGQDAQDDDDEGNEEQQQMSSPENNEVNPENNVVNNQPPLLSGPRCGPRSAHALDSFDRIFEFMTALTQICSRHESLKSTLPNLQHMWGVIERNHARHIMTVPYEMVYYLEQQRIKKERFNMRNFSTNPNPPNVPIQMDLGGDSEDEDENNFDPQVPDPLVVIDIPTTNCSLENCNVTVEELE